MAYRRKLSTPRATTFEDHRSSACCEEPGSASSLAAQAIRASTAHHGSSLSLAYGESAYRLSPASPTPRYCQTYRSPENFRKTENPTFQKGSESITSSLNHIGGTIKNALEEGLRNVEHKTAGIIQETRKLQIKRKGSRSNPQGQETDPQILSDKETQLKASRDEANAMAAKAKLLLRELKTVKADLGFAKERCRQLEEENKILRDSQEKGDIAKDDDLIRLQLETLLAEKARLAHENSIFARENRFLREIVEYHQLTMQGVVYVDGGIEDDTEIYPYSIPKLSPASISSSHSHSSSPHSATPLSTSPSPLNSIIQEACSTPAPHIATTSTPSNPSSGDGPLKPPSSTSGP